MDTGIFVLGGIFLSAALLMVFSSRRRRGIERELVRRGFVACEEEAPELHRAFTALAGGHADARSRRYVVSRCFKRPTGRGMAYRFTVVDRTNADAGLYGNTTGARFDAYLIDLPNGRAASSAPVSLLLSPAGPSLLRTLVAKVASADPYGVPLVLPNGARPTAIVAAWGETGARLEEIVPAETQDRLARGAALGVFIAHLGGERAAFGLNPHPGMLERQWSWIVEWS